MALAATILSYCDLGVTLECEVHFLGASVRALAVFDTRLSLATLFQAPSVRMFAEKMSERAEQSTPAIIPRRAAGSSSSTPANLNEMSEAQVDELLKQMGSRKSPDSLR